MSRLETTEALITALKPKDNGPSKLESSVSSEREYLLSANRRELVKGLGVRYSDCRLSNFVFHGINTDRAKQQKVVERFKSYGEKFRENVEAGQNLVFFGKQGTGKDHLLTVAMFRAISEGYLVKWITGNGYVRQCSRHV